MRLERISLLALCALSTLALLLAPSAQAEFYDGTRVVNRAVGPDYTEFTCWFQVNISDRWWTRTGTAATDCPNANFGEPLATCRATLNVGWTPLKDSGYHSTRRGCHRQVEDWHRDGIWAGSVTRLRLPPDTVSTRLYFPAAPGRYHVHEYATFWDCEIGEAQKVKECWGKDYDPW